MDLDIIHDEEDLRFYAVIAGDEAELTYTYPESGVMDFDHTFVPEGGRGKGYADRLVQSGLDYARSQNYQVVPSCPVVGAFIKRHPDYEDLVQPE
ncbi:GNAT family N-acetyltransferase [Pontibacter russatus]|uniref:GNAT family N-acetyltransferase n=1 Tax=Pontibacter russatus TaxID=2694929 RepID=UPI00137A85A5|nr:GNAT family N-acetyltransferase [Pontibacter russatus]